jgi:hypothetical protein
MKKMILAISVILMMSGAAYANTVSQDCGCGLGRVLIGDKEGLVWNLLGTCLNGTCGNQTFGMTTGTLGCDTGGKIVMNEQVKIFVADNMDNLATDIASGQGESLDALAEIAGIPADKKASAYTALQANFDSIYPDAHVSDVHVSASINEIIANI